jgi:hypothetical protein
MQLIVAGIDPGAKGAIAFVNENMSAVTIFDWKEVESDPKPIYDLLTSVTSLVTIESVHPQRYLDKQTNQWKPEGGISSFSLGRNLGAWEMLLKLAKVPYIVVTPQRWQRGVKGKPGVLDKFSDKGDIKQQVWEFAKRRWPKSELSGPRGGRLDGRSDALCLALYALREAQGIPVTENDL